MADFSDFEDRALVQHALQQEKQGRKRVSWIEIANQMKSSKTPDQLRMRLVCLRKRFGRELIKFPRWYFANVSTQQKTLHRKVPISSATEHNSAVSLLALFDQFPDSDEDACTPTVGLNSVPKSCLTVSTTPPVKKLRKRVKNFPFPLPSPPLSTQHTYLAVREVFISVLRADVRQPSGRLESNVGELEPEGTTAVIEACALNSSDVFVDVGSGVGNVVAQVALETNVGTALGVEIRTELARQGSSLMEQNYNRYSQLRKVKIYPQDICAVDVENDYEFKKVTVLFCHNTVFKPEVLHVLEQICCRLPLLRTVILSVPFCARHRPSCLREFCTLFRARESRIKASVTFTHSLASFFVYDRWGEKLEECEI